MKKIISILVVCLLQSALAVAASFDLKVELTPEGAGTLNTSGGSYEEGSKVNLRTYNNTGYVFLGWYEGDVQLSTATSFSYVMPAHDAVVTARYEFDPAVPADPDSVGTQYTLTLECKPDGGGSFNTRSASVAEGDSVRLYAYTNTGYKFLQWEDEQGKVISTAQNFYYVMPHGNRKIYGVFDFDPEPPSNPSKNYWNEETGEVIIDDFTPGRLSDALSSAIGYASRDQVTMITVVGVMTSNDFGIANYYENCTLLDLSRVTGITTVPSYAFDYTNLESVFLPSTIETIGNRAFYGCSHLASLTIYAMTPPTLGSYVFTNVPEGLVVYVPAASIGLYQKADGWSNCTILPLQDDVCSITVQLPEESNGADYANMTLQLTNTDNGQTSSYTTSGKHSYTFSGIPVQTRWTVTMSNQRGNEFGRIDNVIVADEDVTVTFTSLKKVCNVSLNVVTPDGVNVTDKTTVSWYSSEGAFLAEGTRLNSVPYGEELLYSIKLTGDLRYQYQEHQRVKLVADDAGAQQSVSLQPIPQVNVTGCVKNEYGILSGADVTLTQWANGQYGKTATTKTSQDGTFSFTAIDDSTRLVVSSPRYRDVVIQCARFGADTDLGTLTMNRVTGIVVVADTRTQAIGSETTFPTVTGSVGYSLYNKTTGRQVEDMVVQGRNIIIPSETKAGDRMTLTVNELSGNYLSTTTDFVIAENDTARVRLIMQELGGIESSFEQSANTENEVLLYDGDGNLCGHADYSAKKATFAHLSAGTYTLVAIGKSLQRGNLLRLADFAKTGMKEGTDYLQAEVAVTDGEMVAQTFATIPQFDESLFNYTSSDSYVQVNKLSVAAGQYVTLSCRAYFKEQYDSAIDNINIIVDLPENCQLIDNSLIVGNAASPYTVEEGRIIVPLTREQRSERIRLCVVPTAGGTYRLSTSVQFDYEGERIQSLGSVYFQTSSMTISVPSSTCQKSVLVSGKAPRQASVEVFDNGTLVAQTEALKNGQWKVNCPLTDVYNLSDHRISAKIHEESGLVLQTESKTVTYDREAVEPLDVTMTFYNEWMKKNISVFFNLKAGSSSPSSYSFYHTTPITFVANLSNNDPSAVNSVYIHVYTSDEGIIPLRAFYDANLNKWVAVQEFSPGHLPVSVSVSVDYNSSMAYDQKYADNAVSSMTDDIERFRLQSKSIETLYNELESELDKDLPDNGRVQLMVETIIEKENDLYGYFDKDPDSDFAARVDNAVSNEELLDIIGELAKGVSLGDIQSLTDFEFPSREIENGLKTPAVRIHCANPVSEMDFLSIYQKAYLDGFSSAWIINENALGIITMSNPNGTTFTLDFREAIDIPAGDMNDELTYNKYIELLTAYLEELIAVDNEEDYGQKEDDILSRRLSNYHYALRALCLSSTAQSRSFLIQSRVIKKGKLRSFFETIVKIPPIREYYEFGKQALDTFGDLYDWEDIIYKIDYNCDNRYKEQLEKKAKQEQFKQWCDNNIRTLAMTALMKVGNVGVRYAIIGGIGVIGGVASAPFVLAGGIMIAGACAGVNYYYGQEHKKKREEYKRKQQEIRENMERDCCPNGKCDDDDDPDPDQDPPVPPVQPILDPSGFVYEGVMSNRLEGVTATVFYKAQTEDMYGDIHETVEKWNAEDYGQVNPQITDQEGKYAWDVPQGQWQVKFEKEGYETAYSEWLPVPPPQLDVNIAMRQNVPPTVKTVHAYEESVEMEFDKYMMPEQLNNYNITVIQDGKPVEGIVSLLNEEASYENSDETYASKVRFNAAQPFTAQEVTLMVSNRVKSYAGIRMQDDFSQTFTVEREIKQIVSDSLMVVGYGETTTFTVSVLPALASQGKTLTVKTSSPMILGVKTEQVIIDNNGNAEITVSGELPGTAALTFSIEGTDKSAVTVTTVEKDSHQLVAMPTASITTGSIVEEGTQIELYCSTEGATIYYTTDGSCPCNETSSRKVYDGTPIIIYETTTIKAIAVAPDMTESDVAEFTYIVDGTGIKEVTINGEVQVWPLPVHDKLNVTVGGKTIKNVSILSMNGVIVASSTKVATKVTLDVSKIPTGIYVINVTTDNGTFSRKILKVE